MKYAQPLKPATLIRRYKRFLFDAELDSGEIITGSCPNTGSMLGLSEPGSRVHVQLHDSLTRKYKHSLELVEADGTLVGINTGRPNALVEEAILSGLIPSLAGYETLRREQNYGVRSRIDLQLDDPVRGRAYVEVKNVHFRRQPGLVEFPDTVTARGARHLEELGAMAEAGHRAVMVYLIQRGDCERLSICGDLDPAYALAYVRAMKRGVEALAVRCKISLNEIAPDSLVPIEELPASSI
ncbi:sugar fermentation stimulation protein [Hoeflea marina]|uniref:Sugar fermentation stimulation protein homolog n=1 Tax=Hoeflea marina TaxID=274592 RepID=A0A317PWA0_9HYPH|nr:DNA/RNA nuclease SfsA [Hoeflea marina]PWW03740.1 sugar fermentation stimulation protein [Hoeflea marina]